MENRYDASPFERYTALRWVDIVRGVGALAFESAKDFLLHRHHETPLHEPAHYEPPVRDITVAQKMANEWGAKMDLQDATPETARTAKERDELWRGAGW